MKTSHRWLVPILCTAVPLLLVSCHSAPYLPNDSTVGNMSVRDAHRVLTTELVRGENRMVRSKDFYIITDVRVSLNKLVVMGNEGQKSIFVYSELPQISMSEGIGLVYDSVILAGQETFLVKYPASHKVMNALYVLKQHAIKTKGEADEFDSRFTATLADNRKKAAVNAALPEEANKYKVQAEVAVRDKEFDDAADIYAAALRAAPWWPAGHFNRALVLGEAGDYDMAKREMKYYLQLVPDASNARAAQDKIYEWERKAM